MEAKLVHPVSAGFSAMADYDDWKYYRNHYEMLSPKESDAPKEFIIGTENSIVLSPMPTQCPFGQGKFYTPCISVSGDCVCHNMKHSLMDVYIASAAVQAEKNQLDENVKRVSGKAVLMICCLR